MGVWIDSSIDFYNKYICSWIYCQESFHVPDVCIIVHVLHEVNSPDCDTSTAKYVSVHQIIK